MINKQDLVEIMGWYGMIAILIAYALVSFKIVGSNNLLYQILNLTGAAGMVIVSISKGAKQPALLNIIWYVIALVAIIQLLLS